MHDRSKSVFVPRVATCPPPLVLALGILLACGADARPDAPTGFQDIDATREAIRATPTTGGTAAYRRAALYRWWRLLWQQGYDLRSFDDAATQLVYLGLASENLHRAIDDGFASLESIQAGGARIQEAAGDASPAVTSRTDWPGYHGTDGAQTGYSPDAGPAEGRLAWRFPKGYTWYARPTIRDGRVYAAAPGGDVIGYCLDEKTGEMVWRARQYGTQSYGIPGSVVDAVVSSNRVLIATGWTAAERFFVLDRETGDTLEQRPAGSETGGSGDTRIVYKYLWRSVVLADAETGEGLWRFQPGGFVAGEPVLAGDRVFVNQATGTLHCLDAADGRTRWHYRISAGLRGSPAAGAGTVYAGDTAGRLHAVDAATGEARWIFDAEEREDRAYQFFSTATEANGRVYVGAASGYLYCLDANGGALIWRERLSDWVRSRPLVLGTTVYCATLDSRLTALRDRGHSAKREWSVQLGEHGFTADLVGNENGIVASGRDVVMYSVSPETGRMQWRHSLLDGIWIDGRLCVAEVYVGKYQSSPVVVDGTVFLGGPDGFLNAIDAETGTERWRFETRGGIDCTPRVAEGKVFVGQNGWNREYYAVDQQTGHPAWTLDEFDWVGCGATGYARVFEHDEDPGNDRGRLFVGTISGELIAIDAADGAIAWRHKAGPGKGFYPHPATDAARVYTGSHDGSYYAFNQETGAIEWSHKTGLGPRGGNPDSAGSTLWQGHLYVQKRGTAIAALDRNTGEEAWAWQAPAGFLQNGAVAAFDDRVFGSVVRMVTAIPYHAAIHAFDDVAHGGGERWTYRGGGGLTAPVGAPGKLVFGSSGDVFLTCLDPADGTVKWRWMTGGPMEESTPAIYGDKVFALSRNGYLHAVK